LPVVGSGDSRRVAVVTAALSVPDGDTALFDPLRQRRVRLALRRHEKAWSDDCTVGREIRSGTLVDYLPQCRHRTDTMGYGPGDLGAIRTGTVVSLCVNSSR